MRVRRTASVAGWRCIEAAAALLSPPDREIVLGDLAEMGNGAWRGLGDVLGLAARRQFALWTNWRPWATSLGLALPASFFLMGWSVAASGAVAGLFAEPQARPSWLSLFGLLLVVPWAWMAGFVVGAVSRGTLWACILACSLPCLVCLSEWPGHGISCLRLLVFLLPGLWGVWRGRRNPRLSLGWAVLLAAMATPLMACSHGASHGFWMFWPGLYLAATAGQTQQ